MLFFVYFAIILLNTELKIQKMKIKIAKKISSIFLLNALFLPSFALAQFVIEEKRETPSQFAQQGLETLNITVGAINVFLALLFLSSIIGLLVAGVRFVIAGGSEGTLSSARKTALASIMGLIFSLVGYLIINTIKHFVI